MNKLLELAERYKKEKIQNQNRLVWVLAEKMFGKDLAQETLEEISSSPYELRLKDTDFYLEGIIGADIDPSILKSKRPYIHLKSFFYLRNFKFGYDTYFIINDISNLYEGIEKFKELEVYHFRKKSEKENKSLSKKSFLDTILGV